MCFSGGTLGSLVSFEVHKFRGTQQKVNCGFLEGTIQRYVSKYIYSLGRFKFILVEFQIKFKVKFDSCLSAGDS